MSSGISTTIRIKPYLKEFILNRFLNGQYKSSADDTLGKVIKPFLVQTPANLIRIDANSDDNYFTFELPNYTDKKVRVFNYIQPCDQRYIEDIFETLFREAMFHHVTQNLELHPRTQKKDWIISWCQMNNITFSKLKYDTLKKAFYRYELDQEEKKKNEKNSTRSFPSVSPRFHFIVPSLSRGMKCENEQLELELTEPINTFENEL